MTEVPQTSAPVCYRHPSRETYVRCTRCDRPICPDCMTPAAVGHQCPECVSQGRKTQRPVRTAFGGSTAGAHGYVTTTLIAINCVVLALSVISAGSHAGRALFGGDIGGLIGGSTPLADKLAVAGQVNCSTPGGPIVHCAYGVATGQYYRLFTAMFMHYGLIHLAMNMYALWVLGRPLEAMLGPVRFTAVYLVCGLGGNVAALVFAPGSFSAGASTALFGLFGVFFFVLRKLGRSASGLIPILIINLLITISVPNISIAGHIGGLITGGVLGYGIAHAPRAYRGQVQAAIIVAVFLVLGATAAVQANHLNALPHLG